jgi:hypothetical protein
MRYVVLALVLAASIGCVSLKTIPLTPVQTGQWVTGCTAVQNSRDNLGLLKPLWTADGQAEFQVISDDVDADCKTIPKTQADVVTTLVDIELQKRSLATFKASHASK